MTQCEAWTPDHPAVTRLFFLGHIDGRAVYACQLHLNEVEVDDEDENEVDDE